MFIVLYRNNNNNNKIGLTVKETQRADENTKGNGKEIDLTK